jgi:predicted dehydrogenase
LCDVDLAGKHTQSQQKAHPNAKRFTDFRKMFDEMADQIDAVLIATADHSHFAIAMLAMSLGKHVYVEKPLAHTFGQCQRLIDLADRSGVATQMGNQGHSGGNYFQFKAWSEAGVIKDVTRITAHMNSRRRWHGWGTSVDAYPTDPMPKAMDWDTWVGPAPVHPFSRKLHPAEWRSWFDYGSGAFGDWGPHILDTCHRFLDLGLPEKITAVHRDGANPLVYPQASTIRFDFPAREGKPPCEVTWYDGTGNKPEIESKYRVKVTDKKTGKSSWKSASVGGPGKIIYGNDMTFKGGSHGSTLSVLGTEAGGFSDRSLPEYSSRNSNHYANFLLACQGEEESRSPFSVSGPLTQVFNLGVIAQRLGGEITFDRDREQITNNEEAQALMDPSPRAGWEEFYPL